MKKIYLSLITALAGLSLNAQLTNANHSPANGDLFSTWQVDSTAGPGASGAGVLWNFSTVTTHSSIVSNYTVATNTNTSYPTTNGVSVGSSSSNLGYYSSSATSLNYWGGNLSVNSIPATLVYTASAVKAAYPMNVTTTSTSATGGNITISSISGTFNGNSNTIADGSGTLALANGTFTSVFRVVTTQTISFTIPLVGTGTVTQKSYDYYDVSMRNALYSITSSTVATSTSTTPSSQTIATRFKTIPTGINNNNNVASMDLNVYPNPSNTTLNFATESAEAKQVIIHDVTGRLVEKQNLNDGKLKLDVSNYNTGIYMYTIVGNANQTLKSGKVTVSH